MVQRCSNGAPFVVLEAEPAVRTGILVEIYDGANPSTLLDVLPDTFGRQWVDELKGVGSGRFKVSARNPKLAANPDLLAYGNLARFKLDNVTRFTMLIEHRTHTVAAEGEDGERIIEVSGRGALAVLEDALVYATGGLTGEVERLFTTTAGAAMATLVGEAKARGTLGAVTLGFTGSVDSNNAPYALPVELTERAGTDLLRVAERHAEVAVDVWMTPSLQLRYFNTRGVDRTIQTVDTGPVVLRLASNVAALTVDEDGAIRNTLLIETPGGLLERVEGASVSQWRRREAFLSLGNTTASDQIDRSAEAVFRRSAQPAPDVTLEVDDVDGARPYVDFGLGDWVFAPDETGDLVRVRVRGLTVQDGPNGNPQFIPEVASVTAELEARLERWLAAMARGTVGGTAAEVAEPNKAPAEIVEAIDSGVADHLADAPHVDELADLADVDLTGLADGDLLRYDAGASNWVRIGRTVDDLADVNAPTPAGGQTLTWVDPPGEWRAITPSGGDGGGGGSSVTYVGAELTSSLNTGDVDLTVALPVGVQADDLLILIAYYRNSYQIGPPGWNLAGPWGIGSGGPVGDNADDNAAIWWKVAEDASTTVDVPVDDNGTDGQRIAAIAARGAVGIEDIAQNGSPTLIAPSVKGTVGGLLICAWGSIFDDGGSYTAPPADMTERLKGNTGFAGTRILVATKALAATGHTGAKIATASALDQYVSNLAISIL